MISIDFSKSEQYTLSIRLSADGFSFSIHYHRNKSELFFASYPINASYSMTANLKEMINSTEAFKYSYKEVNVLIDTPRITFVPFELFEDEQIEQIFHHNFSPKENETILCNILGKSNIALLFGIDKHTHQLLNEHFPKARFFSCTSPLIEHFTLESRGDNNRKLFAHIKSNLLEAFVFNKGKLVLCNSFNCKQTADKVYYLLYLWQQHGLSQEKDQLHLVGETGKNEELLTELRKFLRKVTVIPTKDIPYDIQSLLICE